MTFDVKRILVGVDDSEDAVLGFDYAINLAKKSLMLLHSTSRLPDRAGFPMFDLQC